ncbi:IS1595 family transposase [Sphingomonas limnosediminicola]|uniref:IS1595 family transposase n=1 Tax=Sphingomonas limnosediminicola TaxID=940133 RepID=A0ABP7L658_9SPHN
MNLTNPIYQDADKAREHIEAIHWPNGPVCPHCGSVENIKKLQGKSTRKGVYKCNACTKPFTVTVGTVMEDSKIPLNKWLMAFAMVNGSKKGVSAHQLHRQLGITYKSAWFMEHRIREAMKQDFEPMGGPGMVIEADETFFGKDKTAPKSRMAIRNMNKIVSLVDRTTGRAVSFHVTDNLNADTISGILYTNVRRASRLMTDEAHYYMRPGLEFASHQSVNHSAKEYVRGDVTTNTIEGFFGIFKRGMKGIYQHCSSKHLQRYLNEFDFRYTFRAANGYDDAARTAEALKGARGKRLMYRQPDFAAA